MSGESTANRWQIADQRRPVILVTAVGAASGARAAAAALACAASQPDRAALLIDLAGSRPPRPSPIATAGARELEERLNAHLPEARIASRGQICQLSLSPDPEGIEQIAAALPLVRESAGVIHLPPPLVRPMLEEPRISATGVLLRADLIEARPLTALAVRDLMARGLHVAVLKQPPSWLMARMASLGALPRTGGLPMRLRGRLLSTEDNKFRQCYDRKGDEANDQEAHERIDR
jgi:hypothetical protein